MGVVNLERRNHGRNHSYWVDGVKVISITTVLREGIPHPQYGVADVRKAARFATDHWGELSGVPEDERRARIEDAPRQLLRAAATRGTVVHKYAERLQAGEELDVPEEYVGLVDSYLGFVREWQPREVVVERPFFAPKLMYAGQPDLVADLADGHRWLLDWKTGASGIWPEHALQLAAARFADVWLDDSGEPQPVADLGIEAAACVHLRSDGTYELRPVEATTEAWRAFLHAKEVAAYRATEQGDWIADAALPPTTRGPTNGH